MTTTIETSSHTHPFFEIISIFESFKKPFVRVFDERQTFDEDEQTFHDDEEQMRIYLPLPHPHDPFRDYRK